MSSANPSFAATRLHQQYRLLPGDDFSVATAAVLLNEDVDTTTTAITELVAAGVLEPSGPQTPTDAPAPTGDPVSRYRSVSPPPSPLQLFEGDGDKDAQYRVLRHLLRHCAGVAAQLAPGKHRLAEIGDSPVFDDDTAAVQWFAAEREAVLAAQRVAYALKDLPMTWQFADVAYPPLELAQRHDDLMALNDLGATAAEQLNHPAASALRARLASSWNALGRHADAVLAGQQALKLAERHGDAWSRSTAHKVLGRARRGLRQYKSAFAEFYAAWEIDVNRTVTGFDGRQAAPRTAIGLLAAEIALTHLQAGETAEARTSAQQALDSISHDPRRRRDRAAAVVVCSRVFTTTGDAAEAIVLLNDALNTLDHDVDLLCAAQLTEALADAAAALGDTDQVRRDRKQAIRLYRRAGHDDLAAKLEAQAKAGAPGRQGDDPGDEVATDTAVAPIQDTGRGPAGETGR